MPRGAATSKLFHVAGAGSERLVKATTMREVLDFIVAPFTVQIASGETVARLVKNGTEVEDVSTAE